MRTICIIFMLLVFEKSYGQTIDTSTVVWSGIMIPSGKSYPDAQVLWLRLPKEFTSSKQTGVFISRQEVYQTEFYGLHKLTVYKENNEIVADESKAFKKKLNRGTPFCRMSYRFNYNDKTGYLEGTYMAIDCRGVSGKILLYQSGQSISEDNAMTASHAWVRKLIDDLKANKLSPAKIAEMRAKFVFKPLFFDFDKDLIREEYKDYLKSMALIVLSHSDLRIRVTGHTDGDGSDAYNLELSKRRAKSIVGFFMEQGLSVDRIEIDFRGKREPIAPNSTPEGKQKNRRVDFAFV